MISFIGEDREMTASGQKRRFGLRPMTSGLASRADLFIGRLHVSKVPLPGIPTDSITALQFAQN
jgi:hypothetical protein